MFLIRKVATPLKFLYVVIVQRPKNVHLNYIFVVEIQSKLISRPFIGYCEALAWWPKLMLMQLSVSGHHVDHGGLIAPPMSHSAHQLLRGKNVEKQTKISVFCCFVDAETELEGPTDLMLGLVQ